MRQIRTRRGYQAGNQTLPGRNLTTHIKRGKNPHHSCENPGGALPGNTTQNGQWRGSESDVVNQPEWTDVQTPLDWVGNGHECSNTKTHQEIERQRILYEGRRTHPEIRMGLPRCRTDSESV